MSGTTNNPSDKKPAGHYVYIYRDEKGKIRYAGYGKSVERAMSRNHSEDLLKFVDQGKYTLEVAGQYGSKENGVAVETALISLLDPDLNSEKAPGPSRFQFRPLGVPETFSRRLAERPLEKTHFTKLKARACPVLFVYISNLNIDGDDRREGYSLDRPPSNSKIMSRMARSWQLGRHVEIWKRHCNQSPRLLVGATGPRTRRIIIGAVAIDQQGWDKVSPDKGFYVVPTLKTPNLDACGLRGRLVSPNAKRQT